MSDIVNMSDQFKGLPMADLIGAPLRAACDAQVMLARATADFIKVIGFLPPTDPADPNGNGGTRTAQFKFKRPVEDPSGTGMAEEEVEIVVPLLTLVNVPNLSIQTVDVTFDMEVKSSFSEKEAEDKSLKWIWKPASAGASSRPRSTCRAPCPATRKIPALRITRQSITSRCTPKIAARPKACRVCSTSCRPLRPHAKSPHLCRCRNVASASRTFP